MSDIKQNKFFRVVYTILFAFVYSVTELLVFAIALFQCIVFVVTGEPSASVKKFGAELGVFLRQLLDYVSFKREDKPFPFSDWPSDRPSVLPDERDVVE